MNRQDQDIRECLTRLADAIQKKVDYTTRLLTVGVVVLACHLAWVAWEVFVK